MPDLTRTFISYSHDSEAHQDRARRLADRLTRDGPRVELDPYVDPWPAEGLATVMEKAIENADFALVGRTVGDQPPIIQGNINRSILQFGSRKAMCTSKGSENWRKSATARNDR